MTTSLRQDGCLEERCALGDLRGRFGALAKAAAKHADLDAGKKQALGDALGELREAATL
jgi:hypothetical protein